MNYKSEIVDRLMDSGKQDRVQDDNTTINEIAEYRL